MITFYSLPCLKDILPDIYLEHFSKLSGETYILYDGNITGDELGRAAYLLDKFNNKFEEMDGLA